MVYVGYNCEKRWRAHPDLVLSLVGLPGPAPLQGQVRRQVREGGAQHSVQVAGGHSGGRFDAAPVEEGGGRRGEEEQDGGVDRVVNHLYA